MSVVKFLSCILQPLFHSLHKVLYNPLILYHECHPWAYHIDGSPSAVQDCIENGMATVHAILVIISTINRCVGLSTVLVHATMWSNTVPAHRKVSVYCCTPLNWWYWFLLAWFLHVQLPHHDPTSGRCNSKLLFCEEFVWCHSINFLFAWFEVAQKVPSPAMKTARNCCSS